MANSNILVTVCSLVLVSTLLSPIIMGNLVILHSHTIAVFTKAGPFAFAYLGKEEF